MPAVEWTDQCKTTVPVPDQERLDGVILSRLYIRPNLILLDRKRQGRYMSCPAFAMEHWEVIHLVVCDVRSALLYSALFGGTRRKQKRPDTSRPLLWVQTLALNGKRIPYTSVDHSSSTPRHSIGQRIRSRWIKWAVYCIEAVRLHPRLNHMYYCLRSTERRSSLSTA